MRRLIGRLGGYRALLAVDVVTSARERAWVWLLAKPKPIHPQERRIFYLSFAAMWFGAQLAVRFLPRHALHILGIVLGVVIAGCVAWLLCTVGRAVRPRLRRRRP